MKLYIHPVRIRHYDYDEYLNDSYGVAWSTNNQQGTALGLGVEYLNDHKAVRAKIASVLADPEWRKVPDFEVIEGVAITKRSNMNPHGLI